MKISRQQLTRLINEAASEPKAYTADQAGKSLGTIAAGPNAGTPFGQLVGESMLAGDFKKAASFAMDAMFIDDVWPEEQEALEEMLSSLGADGQPGDVAQVMADWLTDKRANPGGQKDHPSHPKWDTGS